MPSFLLKSVFDKKKKKKKKKKEAVSKIGKTLFDKFWIFSQPERKTKEIRKKNDLKRKKNPKKEKIVKLSWNLCECVGDAKQDARVGTSYTKQYKKPNFYRRAAIDI